MKSLQNLKTSQENIAVLHYATTSFDHGPIKITSLSVRTFSNMQSKSFTINEKITEEEILKSFLSHMRKLKNFTIITWNGKTDQFGPQHMQKRCIELGVSKSLPFRQEDVIDLDEVFAKKFGHNYIDHPKLRKLAEKNKITLKGFVDGKNEPELYSKKEFQKISNSVDRKTAIISTLLKLSFKEKLKMDRNSNKKFLGRSLNFWIPIVISLVVAIILAIIG